jgi:L-ascorbate metabolism protein UlaG (beta-lactamase superfamily)
MNEIPAHSVHITHIGGPTVLIEIGQLRILTDPTFDPAGNRYPSGTNILVKTAGPALELSELGTVDVVLLSHDHHADNLDLAGRAFLPQVEHVLTTPMGAQRLGGETRGVSKWETVELTAQDGSHVRVTATPAQHGPEDIRPAVGDVNGWIVEWDGQERGALYISGDTVLFEEMEQIIQRYKIGIALLHFGAAHVESYGPVSLTFTAVEGASFAKTLGEATIIPIHYEGWAHFAEGHDEVEQAFSAAGLEEHLLFLPPGKPISLDA